jgi:hypothetical protein
MPEMKFWYKEFPLAQTDVFGRKKLYRPIIPVTIEYSGKKVGYEALLDSGADWNLFPAVLGEIIGIDVGKGKKLAFGGIGGGDFTAYFHEVVLSVGGWPAKILCGFSADIPQKSNGVLGHFGFFDHFVVRLETNKREVEVKKI